VKVCLLANALAYPQGGGHLWVYLNWALALRGLGCDVIWLEIVDRRIVAEQVGESVAALTSRLDRFDLAGSLAVCSSTGETYERGAWDEWLGVDAALEADVLVNTRHDATPEIVRRFRRSAFLDIDPGIVQWWMAKRVIRVAPHSLYFTIGETVGRPDAAFPDGGVEWHYTPPCVALDHWHPGMTDEHAPFTTVSHWYQEGEWMEDAEGTYRNDKRAGFAPFLDLPRRTAAPLELALCLADNAADRTERRDLHDRGWRVRDAWAVASTPWDYQQYIQASRGEFSCAKPSCVRLRNAWISDRTLCYLASGKPAIVQHTGPSRVLPVDAGLLRFSTLEEAVQAIERVGGDYEKQSLLARALAEDVFDGRKVVSRLLERAVG
jgi:hypothetical protein